MHRIQVRTTDIMKRIALFFALALIGAKRCASVSADAARHIGKGEAMPQLVLNNPRPIPGLDALLGVRLHRTDATRSLVSSAKQA